MFMKNICDGTATACPGPNWSSPHIRQKFDAHAHTLDALELRGLVACLEGFRKLHACVQHIDDLLVRRALALDGGDLPLGQRPHHVFLGEKCDFTFTRSSTG